MSTLSKVGNSQVSEDGDQRTSKRSINQSPRFEAGPDNAHLDLDSEDQRTISNRLAAAKKTEIEKEENTRTVVDPLKPAMDNGNKPSRGAQIDAQIQAEEEAELRNKGKI